jgi:hypothetical protein
MGSTDMTRRFTVLVLMSALGGGCLGAFPLDPNGGGEFGDAGADVVGAFNQAVAPILTGSCGSCHGHMGGIGPGFLEPKPDILTTMLSYPGIVGTTPETSRIYAKGVHEGPALTGTQAPIVADWIKLYNDNEHPHGDGGARPMITPLKPQMGTNAFDLAQLDSQLAGAKLTFTAARVGGSIELSQIMVVTTPTDGLHLVHPLWVIWDEHYNPAPDPVDSFSNLDETVPPANAMPLGPGTVILPNFGAEYSVSIVFGTLEVKAVAGGDGGVVGPGLGCKNLAAFVQYAKPTLVSTCASCHANPASPGSMAFPLLTLNTTGGDAEACQNALGEIDTATPASSRIYTYTDPASGITHPFKFAAKSSFADMWIVTEK